MRRSCRNGSCDLSNVHQYQVHPSAAAAASLFLKGERQGGGHKGLACLTPRRHLFFLVHAHPVPHLYTRSSFQDRFTLVIPYKVVA